MKAKLDPLQLFAWPFGSWLLSVPCPECGFVHTGNRSAPRGATCRGRPIRFVVQSEQLPHAVEAAKYKQAYATVAKDLKWFGETTGLDSQPSVRTSVRQARRECETAG